MKSIFVAAAALVGIVAVPALAEPSATAKPEGEKAAPAKANPGKRYCFVDTAIDTRVPIKTCKTRAEWVAEGTDMNQFDR